MEVRTIDDKNYPVVDQNTKGKINCPFCFKVHTHGAPDGHRKAHCSSDSNVLKSVIIDGKECFQADGYYVKQKKP